MGGGDSTIPETPESRAQAQIFKAKYGDYLSRWQPVIQYYQQRVDTGEQPTRGLLEGQGVTDVRGNFSNAGQRMQMALRDAGVETGSGRDVFGLGKFSNSEAAATGETRSTADTASDKMYEEGLQKIMAIGQGQQVQSTAGLTDVANLSGRVAEENALASAEESSGLGQAIGTGVGAAGRYAIQPMLRGPQPAAPSQYGITMS